MLIYKRARRCDDFKDWAPPGNVVCTRPKKELHKKRLFPKWLTHFAEIVVPNVSRKILVLLNDHSTHTKNTEALQLARDSFAIMVPLENHTTHRQQPMDVAFLRPLSSHYIDEIGKWLRASPGRCDVQASVAICRKADTVRKTITAFRSTGIWTDLF
jgi:hypothetical protein